MTKKLLLGAGLVLIAAAAAYWAWRGPSEVRVGFLVKQAEEPWFADEWKFADQAAKENGFRLLKAGVSDEKKLEKAIKQLRLSGAQGFVVCVPDVKLGPSVVKWAEENNLKLMTVDDRLLDANGKPIESVPHMGISASKIGQQVGEMLLDEMKKRSWDIKSVGALKVSFEKLPTAKERTDGVIAVLQQAGFPMENLVDAPQASADTKGAIQAVESALSSPPAFKHWISFGMNDETVLGAVIGLEAKGFGAENVIGIGIGGSEAAIAEMSKKQASGFVGTIVISPKRHGFETALNMYNWIKNRQTPDALIQTTGFKALRDNIHEVRKSAGLE